MRLEKGTRVEIIHCGFIYPGYKSKAEEMQLRNFYWGYDEVFNGQTGKILCSAFHDTEVSLLYAVRMDKSRRDIIVRYNGIKVCKNHMLEMEDNLFRI